MTPPIFIDEAVKPLSREVALRSLQLPTDAKYVLIQLGSGAQGGREEFVQQAIHSINELDPQLVPVLLRSPLAKDKNFENLDGQFEVRSQYPVAAHLQAFAFSIVAAGYNSVHENIAALHSAIYVPEARMITVTKVRRAEAMAEMKAGLIVRAVEELPAATAAPDPTPIRPMPCSNSARNCGSAVRPIAAGSSSPPRSSAFISASLQPADWSSVIILAALHPAIYVPEARMITDDQVRRAEAMAEMKAGLIVRAVEELPAAIGQMADPQFRAELEQGIGQIGVGSGAAVAADAIVATIAEARPGLAVDSYHASRGETS